MIFRGLRAGKATHYGPKIDIFLHSSFPNCQDSWVYFLLVSGLDFRVHPKRRCALPSGTRDCYGKSP